MRMARWAVAGLVFIVVIVATAPTRAQILERRTPAYAESQGLARTIPPQRFYRFEPQSVPFTPEAAVEEQPAAPAESPRDLPAPYVTYCVRACDGFYFPLRQNALRADFSEDAARCTSSCNGQARLFYAPLSGGPQTMIDLEGRRYTDAPNAFAYRRALQPGCACKPPPWSLQAIARHREYALAAAVEQAKDRVSRLLIERAPALASSSIAVSEMLRSADREPVVRRDYPRAGKFKIRPAPRSSRIAAGNSHTVPR